MKNARALIMVGLSILAGLGAVLLASRWLENQAQMNINKVAVAAVDINPGARLTPDMIKLVDWPTGSVPEGVFTDVQSLDTRVTRLSFLRGEPILETKLAAPGSAGGLSAIVAEGKRAMTVRVNDVVGVAGFALPGNYVDILVSTEAENDREKKISKLVLERILVLAIAQEHNPNDTRPKVVNAVTLEVTPEEAEKLDLARSVGQLSLVLRNQVDIDPAKTHGATKNNLLQIAVPVKAPQPRPVPKAMPVQRREVCEQILTGAGRITQCY